MCDIYIECCLHYWFQPPPGLSCGSPNKKKNNIRVIAQTNNVLLIWVPGHAKIIGNEIADYLAKRGADDVTSNARPPDNYLHSINFMN